MTRPSFTIVLPVHRPPALLPYAIASVQTQARQDFELFVICDGAPPETASCARAFAANDERIRVYEHPKGERHGEIYRHQALHHARGVYVCHIGDDDLWLPNFLTEMAILLQDVDFGNLSHVEVLPDGNLNILPGDLAEPSVRQRMMNGVNNFFGLTFGGYRLAAYNALPVGWSPRPLDVPSDLHMWRKFLARDGLRFGTRIAVAALKFAAGRRPEWSLDRRGGELAAWMPRLSEIRSINTIAQAPLLQLSQAVYSQRLRLQQLESDNHGVGEIKRLKGEIAQLRSALDRSQSRADKLAHKLGALTQTLSWRLTRPFRRLRRKIAP
jgi:glycosyltransferase involved in cell wall biosynthesis